MGGGAEIKNNSPFSCLSAGFIGVCHHVWLRLFVFCELACGVLSWGQMDYDMEVHEHQPTLLGEGGGCWYFPSLLPGWLES